MCVRFGDCVCELGCFVLNMIDFNYDHFCTDYVLPKDFHYFPDAIMVNIGDESTLTYARTIRERFF